MTIQKTSKTSKLRWALLLCIAIMIRILCPVSAAAETGSEPVRVGYYENEVFQEGAQPGSVKTGYAYEYY